MSSSSTTKVITVLGGNGYVGNRCIKTLLKNIPDLKVYAVCRSDSKTSLFDNDNRVKIIKGDALKPEGFKDVLLESTGIIHTIGTLITTDNNKYFKINKETALTTAKYANEIIGSSNPTKKLNFVYVSAERGLPFPLSLKFGGYLEAKRQAEKELLDTNKFPNLNAIILRPGFVKDNKDRAWSVPLYYGVNLVNFAEKNLLQKIAPGIGEKLQLPAQGIELETLAKYASAGASGRLDKNIYSNDEMIGEVNKLELI